VYILAFVSIKDMKEISTEDNYILAKWLAGGSFVVIICLLGMYWYFVDFLGDYRLFNLSTEVESWSHFATYLNGVVVPIVTILNTYLLYKISISANDLTKKSKFIETEEHIYERLLYRINKSVDLIVGGIAGEFDEEKVRKGSFLLNDVCRNYKEIAPETMEKNLALLQQFSDIILQQDNININDEVIKSNLDKIMDHRSKFVKDFLSYIRTIQA